MPRGVTNLIWFVCIIAFSAISCSPERKLANQYLKEKTPGAILLIAPDFVYKNSFKIPEVKNFESLPQATKDSIAFYTSDVLQYCDDSVYINRFMHSLNRGLTYFGFSVYYNQPADEFLSSGYESYIINIAQIQLEEYLDSISDDTSYDSESQNYMSLFVTAININNWVELTKLNHEQSKARVLYNSQTITDDFTGTFAYYPETGRFSYNYTIDSLDIDKLYLASSELGFRYSQWLFDYIMNDYIRKNLPKSIQQEKFYTFDFKNKRLKRLRWRPFQQM